MKEIIGDCIICDRNTARRLWVEEPENRPFLYTEDEFRAMVTLDTADVERIEALKRGAKGFVYKKGDTLD